MSQITKRALEQSLKNLLLQKPLTRITINDIAEDCGINRMTFYYHFKDIYDLVEWSCMEDARRALDIVRRMLTPPASGSRTAAGEVPAEGVRLIYLLGWIKAGVAAGRTVASPEVAAAAQEIVRAMQDCGCQLNNAYMQHSLLALVVIPELRISDLGIVDVTRFELVDLVV